MNLDGYEQWLIGIAKERGLSRCRLAAELDITPRTLKAKMRGSSDWRLSELVVLSALLGVPLLELASAAGSVAAVANPDGTVAVRMSEVRWCMGCTDRYDAPDWVFAWD